MTVLRDLLNQPHPSAAMVRAPSEAMARHPGAATGQIVVGPGVAPPMPDVPKFIEIPNVSIGALQGGAMASSALPNLLMLVGVGAAAYYFGKRQGKQAAVEKPKENRPIPGLPTVKVGAKVAPALPEGSLKIKKAVSPPLLRTVAPVTVEYDLDDLDDGYDPDYGY
jgi:hypothetical protein